MTITNGEAVDAEFDPEYCSQCWCSPCHCDEAYETWKDRQLNKELDALKGEVSDGH